MKAATPMIVTNLGTYRAQRLNEDNLEQLDAAWHDIQACYTEAIDCELYQNTPLPPIYGNNTEHLAAKIAAWEIIWCAWWLSLTPEERSGLDSSPVIIR